MALSLLWPKETHRILTSSSESIEPGLDHHVANARREASEQARRTSPEPTNPTVRVQHHFTVDVEEYFQVSAFERHVARDSWDDFSSRLHVGMDRLLDLLDRHAVRATFFTLGWIAERHPDLVRRLAEQGHEVASHGWGHRRVTDLTPEAFRDSVRRTKAVLEETSRTEVLGYRAPSYSIVSGREWALDVLIEEGYGYDSSLFPVRRPGYGYAGGSRDAHWLERPVGRLAEFPPSTRRILGWNVPASGGAYLRLFPLALIQSAFREAESRSSAGTFYVHPWELDPEQPRLAVPWSTRIRHYGGLGATAERIGHLLDAFAFGPVRDSYREMLAA